MTIFGAPWDSLSLENLRGYLAAAEKEALLWEAKGEEVRPEHVRRAVCAFGNSYETSYLILGVDEGPSGWEFRGVPAKEEPARWVSDVLAEHVVPLPAFDVKHWAVHEERQVLVVRVHPSAAPPCMYNGTVLERLPGRTVPVKDSLRLLQMVEAGRAAHEKARAAVLSLKGTATSHGVTGTNLVAETRVSSVGFGGSLFTRVHTEGFAALVQATVIDQLLPRLADGLPSEAPRVAVNHRDRGLVVNGIPQLNSW